MKPAMKEERKGEETGRDNVDWEVCQYQNEQLHELSLKCRKDKHYRRRIKAKKGADDLLKSLGVALPEGIDARFVVNTNKTWYFVLPQRPNLKGRDEQELGRDVPGVVNVASFAGTVASFYGCIRS
ncbi:MAG: hypothetical protein OXU50_02210 [Gammaproteobacteria bacterium]|nr:hypothetical protein [Gammaproteobacteria bacterium]MDD9807145.1 hypothetical protein [Gammaproteobacteria bacterium]MDD9868698.1 hypothetical protein [Gammaproteobacteria bacterium]MDD9886440.1 hypothetical protein [Gammaproteobacteria bacterium]